MRRREPKAAVRRKPSAKGDSESKKPKAEGSKARHAKANRKTKTRGEIVLSAAGERIAMMRVSPVLETLARRWAHVVRNRSRWKNAKTATNTQRDRAANDLREAGVADAELDALAAAEHIEITLPYGRDTKSDAIAALPWETLVSGATRKRRGERWAIITRRVAGARATRPALVPKRVLFVESAPGNLAGEYDFTSERRLIRSSLAETAGAHSRRVDGGADESTNEDSGWFRSLKNPTLEGLAEVVEDFQPDIVHFTGIDAHEGDELLGVGLSRGVEARRSDGMYLADADRAPKVASADELAGALAGSSHQPMLVTFTAYNTGANVAAAVVARGAGAAIGFQDRFDDGMAELFYAAFYRAMQLSSHDVLVSFHAAFQEVRQRADTLRGAGIVLWCGRSLTRKLDTDTFATLQKQWESDARLTAEQRADIRSVLQVQVEPVRRLNYSVLHNDCDLFEVFTIRKHVLGRIRDVRVHVGLFVGADRFGYRASFDVDLPVLDFKGRIRIPLTWKLARSIVESVRTGLYVEVSWNGTILAQETFPVILLPHNEWPDNERDGPWLPSFVLPRDPAIEQIVSRARRYLRALTDNHTVGFDGYQNVDPTAEDPGEVVDLQVRALWSAIAYELDLGYINPPPAYSDGSQRLRTPSDVVKSGTGTCIDLALLFASCLEYVEIYPALFLLNDHAFVGYFRTEESHEAFVDMAHVFAADEPTADTTAGSGRSGRYVARRASYPEIVRLVEADALVPLETVALTERLGFADAYEGGMDNLADPERFHSLLDVVSARSASVTPLPLHGPDRT